jgi:gluconolactonase
MELDAKAGPMQPLLTARNSESFRGCNDLYPAANGDIDFTDHGRTGLHDPTGRVYRPSPNGRLNCLIDTGISPNGLVLDSRETVVFVAMTRRQRGLAAALHEARQRLQGRSILFAVWHQRSGWHDHGWGRAAVRGARLAGPRLHIRAEWGLIARTKSSAGPACTNVAIGGKTSDRLYHGIGDRHGTGRGHRCS